MPAAKPTSSKTPLADMLLSGPLDDRARLLIENEKRAQQADQRPNLRRHERDALLGIGPTRGNALEKQELPAFLMNGHRLTPTNLVYEHRIHAILKSFPLHEAPLKRPSGTHLHSRAISRHGPKTTKRPAPAMHERVEARRAVLPLPVPSPAAKLRVRPADAPRLGRPPLSKKKEFAATAD